MSVLTEALSARHRLDQLRLRGTLISGLAELWPLLDPEALDQSFLEWALQSYDTIRQTGEAASALTMQYLQQVRTAYGVPGELPAITPPTLPGPPVMSSLAVTGPVSIKKAMGNGIPLPDAVKQAFVNVSKAASRHVRRASHDTMIMAMQADEAATGWERIARPNACKFCKSLAGTYPANHGNFRAHDGCDCTVEPIFDPDFVSDWTRGTQRSRQQPTDDELLDEASETHRFEPAAGNPFKCAVCGKRRSDLIHTFGGGFAPPPPTPPRKKPTERELRAAAKAAHDAVIARGGTVREARAAGKAAREALLTGTGVTPPPPRTPEPPKTPEPPRPPTAGKKPTERELRAAAKAAREAVIARGGTEREARAAAKAAREALEKGAAVTPPAPPKPPEPPPPPKPPEPKQQNAKWQKPEASYTFGDVELDLSGYMNGIATEDAWASERLTEVLEPGVLYPVSNGPVVHGYKAGPGWVLRDDDGRVGFVERRAVERNNEYNLSRNRTPEDAEQAARTLMERSFARIHAAEPMGAKGQSVRAISHVGGANPQDEMRTKQYGGRFKSAATSSGPELVVWGHNGSNYPPTTTIDHEVGHSVLVEANTRMRAALPAGAINNRLIGYHASPGEGWPFVAAADVEHIAADESIRWARVDKRNDGAGGRAFTQETYNNSGTGQFANQPRRPAVTNYGGSYADGTEDWAETWRLMNHDRVFGGLATATDGRRLHFRDVFPNRAAFVDEVLQASGMSWDWDAGVRRAARLAEGAR